MRRRPVCPITLSALGGKQGTRGRDAQQKYMTPLAPQASAVVACQRSMASVGSACILSYGIALKNAQKGIGPAVGVSAASRSTASVLEYIAFVSVQWSPLPGGHGAGSTSAKYG